MFDLGQVPKEKQLMVRLTWEESEFLKRRALMEKTSVSGLVRSLLHTAYNKWEETPPGKTLMEVFAE